ncbi:hypothetical protein [uncultured Alistipes sp.]|uniref:hypothetical protein n=1 Tax=uncultured Alistipes sp. TaxID=538949 RepID=UPI00260B1DFA|nr:hypothetical protein [uncultured Alistipes sp.]
MIKRQLTLLKESHLPHRASRFRKIVATENRPETGNFEKTERETEKPKGKRSRQMFVPDTERIIKHIKKKKSRQTEPRPYRTAFPSLLT